MLIFIAGAIAGGTALLWGVGRALNKSYPVQR